MAEPWWQRWFLPEQPGLRQFALGATGLLLPVLVGPQHLIPAMAVGITVGVGLGLGWLVLFADPWLRRAPIAALGVYATCFGGLFHIEVLPRWELMMRLRDAKLELKHWDLGRGAGTSSPLPAYQRGEDRAMYVAGRPGSGVVAYTPQALQRWSLFGWRDNAYLILTIGGEIETLWHKDLERLGRASSADGTVRLDGP